MWAFFNQFADAPPAAVEELLRALHEFGQLAATHVHAVKEGSGSRKQDDARFMLAASDLISKLIGRYPNDSEVAIATGIED